MDSTQHSQLPETPQSYWLASTEQTAFSSIAEDTTVDVAVVGGGITGITLALLLVEEGKKVALVEADRLLKGTTGHTTAKITAQHDLIYDELCHHAGDEMAKLYFDANAEALAFIRNQVAEHRIPCDFAEEDAYVYTTSDANAAKIDKEWAAYERLGIPGRREDRLPFRINSRAAVVMTNQARFHPVAYLKHLLQRFIDKGGLVYEQTTALSVEHGSPLSIVNTSTGYTIACDDVVSCTHFPFYGVRGFYFARMYAERSYALGLRLKNEYPGGMYLSADDPPRSIRNVTYNGESILVVGGERHKTGQGICTIKHYEALEQFARETFGRDCEIAYRWSAQDLTTLDKIPYIGRASKDEPHAFVATGYRKWGMTTGTAAALLLKDLIMGNENRYEELFTPSRFYADPSVKTFITQNANVALHLLEGKLEWVRRHPDEVECGEGSVVQVDGKRAGAYREPDGTLHLVDTTCTHMGCEVEWNNGDRTWDCPCHGSRFSYTGEVMEGPAKKPLKTYT
ncbi:FAD dependent oxidoreductase [Paenibacillus curdlanolyticus YK9]|uniref:FAD dependent oxidoreductase n=1 Tax=Paenibacillus curdlanolyticus YK9 TaxID=717606 RepID=E0I3W7_9BACL|nr:FAD-dependent oxidoreductase [Paenibacillus curdlanolyticus]EFM12981.1 FAD dependent oxidoreductase [Paenibacillus curdlanolyticus YK9]